MLVVVPRGLLWLECFILQQQQPQQEPRPSGISHSGDCPVCMGTRRSERGCSNSSSSSSRPLLQLSLLVSWSAGCTTPKAHLTLKCQSSGWWMQPLVSSSSGSKRQGRVLLGLGCGPLLFQFGQERRWYWCRVLVDIQISGWDGSAETDVFCLPRFFDVLPGCRY